MNYKYIALGNNNRIVQGTFEAGEARLVEEWLRQAQLRALSIQPTPSLRLFQGLISPSTRVTRKDVVLFSQTLATLLASGTPLLTAIQLLRNEARSPALQALLHGLIIDLKAGLPLHKGMAKAPKTFPRIYVRLIEAGERSGTLETVLRHLAAYLQREIALVQQVKKALTYPAIVLGTGVLVVGILLTVVLPTFVDLLASFNTDLPVITRVVIGLGDLAQAWKVPGLLTLIALAAGAAWYIRQPQGRRELDRLLLTAPGIGRMTLQWDLARFSRTMSLLLAAGLPVGEGLQLARDSSSNRIFQEAITTARAQVMEGRSLAQALKDIPFLPGLYVQLVKVGEDSGTLEGNLSTTADLYEREVEDRITTLTGLLEPALTLGMGVMVAFIALSVLLPMLSLLSSIQGG